MRLLRQGFRDQPAEAAVDGMIFKRSDKWAIINQPIKFLLIKGLKGCDVNQLALLPLATNFS